jgi:glycine/D-amino acid oxidase-like deaminating enzyme
MDSMFHPDCTNDPYWWIAARPSAEGSMPVPDQTDVAIVGSGYTGLNAAIELADRGFKVTVLEAREFGYGASSRSGGHVSSGLNLGKAASASKPSPLIEALGRDRYNGLLDEAAQSMERVETVVKRENIQCHYVRCGRFVAAHSTSHFRALAQKVEDLNRGGDNGYSLLPPERQREEIGSDYFRGGMLVERAGKLHPALYHRGLLEACRRRGVTLCANTHVTAIKPNGSGFVVTAGGAEIKCNDVLLSTNAYSDRPNPWLRRRVIPLASCIIATEELPESTIRSLIPKDRTINDTKRVLSYFRIAPCGKRLLFGGRETFFTSEPSESGRRLYKRMTTIYPELSKVKITHAWAGKVAMTFDHMPHMGEQDGIHYVAGCNGSGVAMMSYLGYRVAAKIAGANEPSAFDGLPFPTKPLYDGKPWFLPAVGAYFKTMDWLERAAG